MDRLSAPAQDLMESCPSEELARTLLQRLDLDSGCFLLDLSPPERDLLHEHFQGGIRLDFEASDLEVEGPHEIQLPLFLEEELGSISKGAVASAGAPCALAHDQLEGLKDPAARFKRAVLRFQLSHALFLLEDRNRKSVKTCIRFARRTVESVDRLFGSPSLPKKSLYRLLFLLQSWLGHRCEWLGDFEAAA